jgi:hypothetical protein
MKDWVIERIEARRRVARRQQHRPRSERDTPFRFNLCRARKINTHTTATQKSGNYRVSTVRLSEKDLIFRGRHRCFLWN